MGHSPLCAVYIFVYFKELQNTLVCQNEGLRQAQEKIFQLEAKLEAYEPDTHTQPIARDLVDHVTTDGLHCYSGDEKKCTADYVNPPDSPADPECCSDQYQSSDGTCENVDESMNQDFTCPTFTRTLLTPTPSDDDSSSDDRSSTPELISDNEETDFSDDVINYYNTNVDDDDDTCGTVNDSSNYDNGDACNKANTESTKPK
jgi:hypothetical protein